MITVDNIIQQTACPEKINVKFKKEKRLLSIYANRYLDENMIRYIV